MLRTASPTNPFAASFAAAFRDVVRGGRDREDFETFCARRLSIVDKTGTVVPFVWNPLQRKYDAIKNRLRASGKPLRILILKPRRIGFTTFEQAESYYCVQQRNRRVLTLAQDAEKTASIFRIAKFFQERDPHASPIKGPGNTYKLEYPTLNSIFFCGTAAGGGNRGDTFQRVHGSEVAHWRKGPRQVEHQREILAGITEAASHGEIVLETTAKGSELFKILYETSKKGGNEWTPVFFAWFDDPSNADPVENEDERVSIMESLDAREAELVKTRGLSAEQIKWRRRSIARLGPIFKQEYPEDDVTCFLISGTCYFDRDRIVQMLESMPDYANEPVEGVRYRHIPEGYACEWRPPVTASDYVCGCDTSEGLEGANPSGFGILKSDTFEQVYWEHGLFTPRTLAERMVAACRRYNDALCGVEKQNHGHAVIDNVRRLGYSAAQRQLYFHRPNMPGWSTDAQSRPVMLEVLRSSICPEDGASGMIVHDRQLLSECLTFNRQSGDFYGADPGAHDDCVMKWAIAAMMRRVPRARGVRTIDFTQFDD